MGKSGLAKKIVELGWEDWAAKGEIMAWKGKSGLENETVWLDHEYWAG
jgi:hypothetical protein